ncbi:MAG: hypothetical protein WCJ84_05515 [Candidatus Peregrinibacteria bacterium]
MQHIDTIIGKHTPGEIEIRLKRMQEEFGRDLDQNGFPKLSPFQRFTGKITNFLLQELSPIKFCLNLFWALAVGVFLFLAFGGSAKAEAAYSFPSLNPSSSGFLCMRHPISYHPNGSGDRIFDRGGHFIVSNTTNSSLIITQNIYNYSGNLISSSNPSFSGVVSGSVLDWQLGFFSQSGVGDFDFFECFSSSSSIVLSEMNFLYFDISTNSFASFFTTPFFWDGSSDLLSSYTASQAPQYPSPNTTDFYTFGTKKTAITTYWQGTNTINFIGADFTQAGNCTKTFNLNPADTINEFTFNLNYSKVPSANIFATGTEHFLTYGNNQFEMAPHIYYELKDANDSILRSGNVADQRYQSSVIGYGLYAPNPTGFDNFANAPITGATTLTVKDLYCMPTMLNEENESQLDVTLYFTGTTIADKYFYLPFVSPTATSGKYFLGTPLPESQNYEAVSGSHTSSIFTFLGRDFSGVNNTCTRVISINPHDKIKRINFLLNFTRVSQSKVFPPSNNSHFLTWENGIFNVHPDLLFTLKNAQGVTLGSGELSLDQYTISDQVTEFLLKTNDTRLEFPTALENVSFLIVQDKFCDPASRNEEELANINIGILFERLTNPYFYGDLPEIPHIQNPFADPSSLFSCSDLTTQVEQSLNGGNTLIGFFADGLLALTCQASVTVISKAISMFDSATESILDLLGIKKALYSLFPNSGTTVCFTDHNPSLCAVYHWRNPSSPAIPFTRLLLAVLFILYLIERVSKFWGGEKKQEVTLPPKQ